MKKIETWSKLKFTLPHILTVKYRKWLNLLGVENFRSLPWFKLNEQTIKSFSWLSIFARVFIAYSMFKKSLQFQKIPLLIVASYMFNYSCIVYIASMCYIQSDSCNIQIQLISCFVCSLYIFGLKKSQTA